MKQHERESRPIDVPAYRIAAVLLAVLAVGCSRPTAAPKEKFKIGYMICNSEAETLRRFRPLTAWLSAKVGVDFEAVPIDTVDFVDRADELHFTHANSLVFVMMHRPNGVEILAGEKAGPQGPRTKGLVVALARSGLKTLGELKGRTMVFGPPLGPTSFMSQVDVLQKGGIDPDKDLASYSIPHGSFKHEKVIYGVLFGKYDAGAVPALDFERMVADGKIERDDFVILGEGTPIPYCNFAVPQKTDEALAARVKRALLELDTADTIAIDGEVVNVVDRAKIDGYAALQNEDFDVVREMAKRTNMPPYQRF